MNRKPVQILLTVAFLLIACDLSAQKQKPKNSSWYDDKILHFGFSIGFNTMDFKITPSGKYMKADSIYPAVPKLFPGINIQVVTDYRPGKYFDIRFLPGVSFGQRVIVYYKDNVIYNSQQSLESSFLEFPLLLKYKGTRLNNVRPYLITGLNFRYDLAGKKDFDDSKDIYIRLKRPDLYYEAGAGLDFYLYYFKLSVELKISNGIGNIIAEESDPGHQQYRNAIETMRSQIWVLAFHFE
ncbi:MAG: porin family protein [Bacteroidales bacterium]